MILTMLKSKIHRATVTQVRIDYEGSLTVDKDLMEKANLLPNEQIDVLNINNGARFTTYVIEGPRGSGIIGVNGAAARLAQEGDLVIICAYGQIDEKDAKAHIPTVLLMDEKNQIKENS